MVGNKIVENKYDELSYNSNTCYRPLLEIANELPPSIQGDIWWVGLVVCFLCVARVRGTNEWVCSVPFTDAAYRVVIR